jgi:HK97 family phage major capsid protein
MRHPKPHLIRARRRGVPGWLEVNSGRFMPIIAGGAPTPLEQARQVEADALRRWEAGVDRLERLDPDTCSAAELDAAQREVEAAEREWTAAQRKTKVAEARANAPVQPASSGTEARVTGEPVTYSRHDTRSSYFLDLARAQALKDGHVLPDADGAQERLRRHELDVREYAQQRERRADRRMSAELERLLEALPKPLARELQERGLVERRDLSRVDGSGGHFVPPLWLMDEYAAFPRASRPFVEACRVLPMPAGTDNINVPRITTGSLTGVQTADNQPVTEQDMADAVVPAPVRTIAGQQDVAIQNLEQSPIAFDEVVFADLISDYFFRTEDQAFNGTGASGQVLGLLNTAGITAVTYTDASPTLAELWPIIAQALSQARTARRRQITHGWVAPRRQFWATAALDANGRPVIAPAYAGPQNALGVYETGVDVDEDPPLILHNVRHRMSDALPVNLGAGTNEDRVVETRCQDHLFFESMIRARAMSEVLSGTLTVRLQVYSYVAFTAGRYPAGIAVISGTGLVAPAGF